MKTNWQTKKLGDLTTIRTGKKDVNEGNPNGKYPFFTCAREHTFSDVYSFDTEALLIAGNGNVGNVSYCNGKFEAYQRTYVISNFKDILPRYLYIYLDGFLRDTVSKRKLGNTMPYIKMGMLTDFQVPFPPLSEQHRVVAVLDETFTAIAKAKENTEKNLRNSRKIFESYLESIFKNSEWKTKDVSEVCSYISRGISPKYVDNDGILVLNQKCIRNHVVDYSRARRHSLLKSFSKDKLVQIGDVLINSTGVGTLGRVARVDSIKELMVVDSHITIVRPLELFDAAFFGWLMVFIEKIIEQLGEGTSGQTELSRSALRKIKLHFPESIIEQKNLVVKLDVFSEQTKKLEKIYKRKIELLEELKKSVLKKVFTGEL